MIALPYPCRTSFLILRQSSVCLYGLWDRRRKTCKQIYIIGILAGFLKGFRQSPAGLGSVWLSCFAASRSVRVPAKIRAWFRQKKPVDDRTMRPNKHRQRVGGSAGTLPIKRFSYRWPAVPGFLQPMNRRTVINLTPQEKYWLTLCRTTLPNRDEAWIIMPLPT